MKKLLMLLFTTILLTMTISCSSNSIDEPIVPSISPTPIETSTQMHLPTAPITQQLQQTDAEVLAVIDLSVDMGSVRANVTVNLEHVETNTLYPVLLPDATKNHATVIVPIGTYHLVDSSVLTTDNKARLGYYVAMDDVTLDLSNPNGNWTWYVTGKLKAEVALPTKKPTPTTAPEDKVEFRISEDNVYFPNMTIPEIHKWYVDEVTAFVSSGRAQKNVEDYKSSVSVWTKHVGKNVLSWMETSYKAGVELYNKEETMDFYHVQKKLYLFIKDYFDEHGKLLNFSTWRDSEATIENPISKEREDMSLRISENNPYFPNMTLLEIKQWYENEVTLFVESGKTSKSAQQFTSAASKWTNFVTGNTTEMTSLEYETRVEYFNTEDTEHFYEVQKKMYDFIKDSRDNYGILYAIKAWWSLD